jgi:hypothetical protein
MPESANATEQNAATSTKGRFLCEGHVAYLRI